MIAFWLIGLLFAAIVDYIAFVLLFGACTLMNTLPFVVYNKSLIFLIPIPIAFAYASFGLFFTMLFKSFAN